MKKLKHNLRFRMLGSLLVMLIPLLLVVNLMFYNVMQQEREQARVNLQALADNISSSVASITYQAYSTSDVFAEDRALMDRIDRVYEDHLLKRSVIVTTLNRQLERYNRLVRQEKIDAILVNATGEIYDFLDPNQDEDLVRAQIDAYGMNDQDRIGQFHWYPLTDNFLVTESYGELRKDTVILGSRRVYSDLRSGYPYLHVFAIPEQTFYDQYAGVTEQTGAEVYILNSEGNLISSSDEAAVRRREAPPELRELHRTGAEPEELYSIGGTPSFVAGTLEEGAEWTAWTVLPDAHVVAATRTLYLKIMVTFLVCILCSGAAMLWQYRRYMMPIARLAESIREVDRGNLHAYVDPCGEQEMYKMMQLYNLMLQSVEQNMEHQVRAERTRKELEMQALAAQINPHFLYNTLETIVWKANEVGRPDIGKIASSLGKMYRLAIKGGIFVPLSQELDHLKAYNAIQKSRHGDKVDCVVRCRDVDPREVRVLKLMLQPMVENCYLYAGEGKEGPLRIRVDIRRRGENLEIRVTDNGIGMDAETLARTREQMVTGERVRDAEKARRSSGIGMHNIYARLQIYQKNSTMELWSRRGLGTVIRISMPLEKIDQ